MLDHVFTSYHSNARFTISICHFITNPHKLRTTCQCVSGGIRQLCISVLRQAVQTCTDVCARERVQMNRVCRKLSVSSRQCV